MYNVTQDDVRLLKQRQKEIDVRIEIKNKDFKTLDKISGKCMSFNYDISSDSGIRRTANLTVLLKDKNFDYSTASLFWIDKIVYISIGYKNMRTGKFHYYPVAHFYITENSISYSATTNELSMSLVDMMAMFTGDRGGNLVGKETKIYRYDTKPVEEYKDGDKPITIREVIVRTVTQLGKWDKYRIDDVGYDIPYDIEFNAGVTVFEILEELVNLYPAWEFFFDEDGMFICQEIPTCAEDEVVLNDDILADLIIEEPYSNSFSEVFNITEVFGKCWETDYFMDETVKNDNQYNCKIDVDNFVYQQEKYYGFTVPDGATLNADGPTLKINELASLAIINEDGTPLEADTLLPNYSYVVKIGDINNFDKEATGEEKIAAYYQGQYQIHAIATLWSVLPEEREREELINNYKTEYNCNNMSFVEKPDNPFTIDKIGEIVNKPIEDEAIWLDKDCLERAEYENWKTTVLANTVSMQCISIPWLDVNQKIEHHLAKQNVKAQYIIKSISHDVMEGIMNVEMIDFYPLYPYITTQQALENSKVKTVAL